MGFNSVFKGLKMLCLPVVVHN